MPQPDFERLFDEYAQPLFAFLNYRTGNRTLSEDLVADTFERVLRSRRRFDPRKGSERSWIYTIALNLLRDRARRETVERRVLERVGSDARDMPEEDSAGTVESRDELSRALAKLSDAEREAVSLRFGADLTVREVARVLGDNEAAVEKRISRSLVKMREELE